MNKKSFFHVLKSIGVFMSLLAMLIMLLNTSTTMTSQAAESSQDTNLSISQNHPASRVPNEPTIIGGKEAEPGAWPWQVAVVLASQIITEPSLNFFNAQACGGSLIHPEWVVTAAHCTYDPISGVPVPAQVGNVVAGIHNIKNPDSAYFQRMEISQIIRHPDYDADTNQNDIALFKLAEPVTLNERIQIIPMNTDPSLTISGTSAIVTGWGMTGTNTNKSNVLKQVSLPVVNNQECNDIYQNSDITGGTLITITEGMICAGGIQNQDSCENDSGGGLVVPNANNDGYVLAGLVNFGASIGCGTAGIPGGYARISYYESWVAENINHRIYLPIAMP